MLCGKPSANRGHCNASIAVPREVPAAFESRRNFSQGRGLRPTLVSKVQGLFLNRHAHCDLPSSIRFLRKVDPGGGRNSFDPRREPNLNFVLRAYLLLSLSVVGSSLAAGEEPDLTIPALTNVRVADYPRIHPDLRITFRIKAPDAKKVKFDCGKRYTATRSDDGFWTATRRNRWHLGSTTVAATKKMLSTKGQGRRKAC
jgi:hypothetical protein